MERNVMIKTFAKKNIGALVLDNPIVLRDLRATMRGTRAFWVQGVYLLLLGIIALTGYATATGQSLIHTDGAYDNPVVFDVVNAQWRLQGFYYFIFVTLASLIALIAPALTATSVSDERQRQSLDLLVTTPLSAAEMLIGKLMSSLAFLGLLLVLSLPASVLCILLGGATIGDVFRIYFMLALDAIVLAAIGLYFSCACKNSFQSLIWTYGSVAAFTAITFYSCFAANTQFFAGTPEHHGSLLYAIAALSPFFIVMPATQSIVLGPVTIPIWLALIPVAFVTVRILLTAAAYRSGMFGGSMARSLRKQVLGITAFATFAFANSAMSEHGALVSAMSRSNSDTLPTDTLILMSLMLTALFLLALPFLPALFVPVRPDDAPPGEAQEAHIRQERGLFRIGDMLAPRHSGSLPYYYAWLLTAVVGLVGGIVVGNGWNAFLPVVTAMALLYVGGAGTLVWGLSRLSAQWLRSASSARALSFGLFALTLFVPGFILALISMNVSNWQSMRELLYPFMLWLGAPFVWSGSLYSQPLLPETVMISGVVALLAGLAAGAFAKPKTV